MAPPKHWSYTAWSADDKCPLLYYESYHCNNRSPMPPSAARGVRIHSLAEYYLKGNITGGVPGALAKFKTEFKALKAAKPVVEEFWGVTPEWEFKPDRAWCVMKMDAAVLPTRRNPVLEVIDFKTGREYPENAGQGELYVSIGVAKHPEIKKAVTEFWYLDLGYAIQREYSRSELLELAAIWNQRGLELMAKTVFKPRPSKKACEWCHLRTDRGGSCNEWTKVYG